MTEVRKKKPVRKAALKKKKRARTTISEKVDAKPILPGSGEFKVIETGRGRRKNHVSDALNEMLQIAISKGHTMFQVELGKPLTITQVRYWAKNKNLKGEIGYLIDFASASNADAVNRANHIEVGFSEELGKIQVKLVTRNKSKTKASA